MHDKLVCVVLFLRLPYNTLVYEMISHVCCYRKPQFVYVALYLIIVMYLNLLRDTPSPRQ